MGGNNEIASFVQLTPRKKVLCWHCLPNIILHLRYPQESVVINPVYLVCKKISSNCLSKEEGQKWVPKEVYCNVRAVSCSCITLKQKSDLNGLQGCNRTKVKSTLSSVLLVDVWFLKDSWDAVQKGSFYLLQRWNPMA